MAGYEGVRGPRAPRAYREGPPMGPEELRDTLEVLGLGGQRISEEAREFMESRHIRIALGPDQVAWMLRWPGLDGRQVRRMKSDLQKLAVPQAMADWLRAACALMESGRPQEAYAVLALPPAVPPESERFWNRRQQGEGAVEEMGQALRDLLG